MENKVDSPIPDKIISLENTQQQQQKQQIASQLTTTVVDSPILSKIIPVDSQWTNNSGHKRAVDSPIPEEIVSVDSPIPEEIVSVDSPLTGSPNIVVVDSPIPEEISLPEAVEDIPSAQIYVEEEDEEVEEVEEIKHPRVVIEEYQSSKIRRNSKRAFDRAFIQQEHVILLSDEEEIADNDDVIFTLQLSRKKNRKKLSLQKRK
jgi:hypothetical protein